MPKPRELSNSVKAVTPEHRKETTKGLRVTKLVSPHMSWYLTFAISQVQVSIGSLVSCVVLAHVMFCGQIKYHSNFCSL